MLSDMTPFRIARNLYFVGAYYINYYIKEK